METQQHFSHENALVRFGTFEFSGRARRLSSPVSNQHLTIRECELLALLCDFANRILPRSLALKILWRLDTRSNARSMDVYISRLRKYFRCDPNVQLVNIYGKGYKLVVPGITDISGQAYM